MQSSARNNAAPPIPHRRPQHAGPHAYAGTNSCSEYSRNFAHLQLDEVGYNPIGESIPFDDGFDALFELEYVNNYFLLIFHSAAQDR
jgi:hypothetical protein